MQVCVDRIIEEGLFSLKLTVPAASTSDDVLRWRPSGAVVSSNDAGIVTSRGIKQ